jgi:integrase
MRTTSTAEATEAPNVIPMPVAPAQPKAGRARAKEIPQPFRIVNFANPSGETVYRVAGTKRERDSNGNPIRVRENFPSLAQAQARQTELNLEYHQQKTEKALRATSLTEEQLSAAEAVFLRGLSPAELLKAGDYWIGHGKEVAADNSPRLLEAVASFQEWLKTADFRERTKDNLRIRVDNFANSVPNSRLSEITADTIFGYLEKRNVSHASKDNDRRALSRFFGYCIERPRKWIALNPARKEKRERRTNGHTPAILSLEACESILGAAEQHRAGRLAPYVALCLFGGLRPFEAARLRLEQINLKDGEIRLEPDQTKTKAGRVVSICPTLKAWLERYEGKPIFPANWRKDFDLIKAAAGYGNPKRLPKRLAQGREQWEVWPDDVLRHTAISHFFRKTGSYGLTAEQFGNSEAIIKTHYQGRVSSDDTAKFYALLPSKASKGRKAKASRKAKA